MNILTEDMIRRVQGLDYEEPEYESRYPLGLCWIIAALIGAASWYGLYYCASMAWRAWHG